jgi:hypothetical protein
VVEVVLFGVGVAFRVEVEFDVVEERVDVEFDDVEERVVDVEFDDVERVAVEFDDVEGVEVVGVLVDVVRPMFEVLVDARLDGDTLCVPCM